MYLREVYKITPKWIKDDRNRHFESGNPYINNEDYSWEILEMKEEYGTKGATLLKCVETGHVINIDDTPGYWCFFNNIEIIEGCIKLIKTQDDAYHAAYHISQINAPTLFKVVNNFQDTQNKTEAVRAIAEIDMIRRQLDLIESNLMAKLEK